MHPSSFILFLIILLALACSGCVSDINLDLSDIESNSQQTEDHLELSSLQSETSRTNIYDSVVPLRKVQAGAFITSSTLIYAVYIPSNNKTFFSGIFLSTLLFLELQFFLGYHLSLCPFGFKEIDFNRYSFHDTTVPFVYWAAVPISWITEILLAVLYSNMNFASRFFMFSVIVGQILFILSASPKIDKKRD